MSEKTTRVEQPPFNSRGCWATPRLYISQMFPAYGNCAKDARPGTLTCHWHAHLESKAQALKARTE